MSNLQTGQGIRLKSIDVWYKVATANLSGMSTVSLSRNTGKAHTLAMVGASVSVQLDTAHQSSAN